MYIRLNIHNYVNSTENIILYMYGLCRFAEKLNIQNWVNSTGNCVNYMYGLSGFAKKFIRREIVYDRCTDYLNLQKDWIFRIE